MSASAVCPSSWRPEEVEQAYRHLTPAEQAELDRLLTAPSIESPDLAAFVEATSTIHLDPWQQHLCARLARLKDETGQRLLIHAPPQAGKSILVSQRFPAWLLGHKPTHRVKLACYNITHATRFGKIVRDLMHSAEYAGLFPDAGLRVPKLASAEEWTTAARGALRDAQPSFKALGLLTGFVGQGADTLIIDDPYASPQDAYSELIRESVWTFWSASAKVRLNDATNVVVMFHRYHLDDLAGKLLAEGGWELLRYAALADGDQTMPDPLGRAEGERLSPRMSDAYLETMQEDQAIWLGQFQGRPIAPGGSFFKVGKFEFADVLPVGLREVRAWDTAASKGKAADWTAGVKIGTDGSRFYVADVRRGRWAPDERNGEIKTTAALDGKPARQHFPQNPGDAGVDQALAFVRLLAGYTVKTSPISGDKVVRADPFASQVNAGNVTLLRAPWNAAYVSELEGFPLGKHDDQVDASADAFNELAGAKQLRVFTI